MRSTPDAPANGLSKVSEFLNCFRRPKILKDQIRELFANIREGSFRNLHRWFHRPHARRSKTLANQ